MKLKDIILEYLMEQPDPNPEQELDPNAPVPGPEDNEEPDSEEEPTDEPEGDPTQEPEGTSQVKQKVKKQSPFDIAKERWQQEVPGIESNALEGGITFFNNIKTNLQPLPTSPDQRAQPDVYAMSQRFANAEYPEYFGKLAGNRISDTFKDVSKLRDIGHYTWAMIEFLVDRASEADARESYDFSIEGDTPEIRKQSAMAKWEKSGNKIIDENGLVVFRVQSKDESKMLGLLQHILVGQYGGMKWCITYLDSSNYYNNYRPYRSYYFVMDKNKSENDPNYISVLQPIDTRYQYYSDYGPYVITPRPNGDQTKKTWEDVVAIWPELRGKENLIKFFGETNRERAEKELKHINFNKNDQRNYFGYQSPNLQFNWIDNNNLINDPEAFLMMRKELQTEYVRRVTLDNYKTRFTCSNTNKPFGMLDALSKNDKRLLDVRLKENGIKAGINAVKASILKVNLNQSFKDINNPNIMLFEDRYSNGKFGVIDLSTMDWLKELNYTKGRAITMFDPEKRTIFVVRSYVSLNGDDYFYLILPKENLVSKDKEKLSGIYLDGPEGDEYIKKYKRLGE
jgi:hypothetical protein